MTDHLESFWKHWTEIQACLNTSDVILDGETLSFSHVVAVSRYNATSRVSDDDRLIAKVRESHEFLMRQASAGTTIYGANTGFGGSADLRTSNTEQLQKALLQLLNVGILAPSDKGINSKSSENLPSPESTFARKHTLPDEIVRGMMLIRCNSLIRGHSGVSMEVIHGIHKLLETGTIPIVPLRGSISASGDLIPLSYIASVLDGNPDIYVKLRQKAGKELITTADKALTHLGMHPLRLDPKSGLAMTNGTATSAAAASIALFEAHQLTILSQILTAAFSESLAGSVRSFSAYVAEARPHPGQMEVATNLRRFLTGSQLTAETLQIQKSLAQDRYPLRTAPQWIGPVVERLALAQKQIEVELNSTTDNPLFDVASEEIYNGGNFQALSVTSAMEITSSSMQMLARLVFAQSSELLNHGLNPDLPPNLSSDDPSRSMPMKGLDISMAAYMAEIAQMAQPVSAHIQSAEMSNQTVNSMALVAARIALDSTEILSLMVATYLYSLCQALDLRCLQAEHWSSVKPLILLAFKDHLTPYTSIEKEDAHAAHILQSIESRWLSLTNKGLDERCRLVSRDIMVEIFQLYEVGESRAEPKVFSFYQATKSFQSQLADSLRTTYEETREAFFTRPSTPKYLGLASKALYGFVREELEIPFHRGLVDHPTMPSEGDHPRKRKIIGSFVSDLYGALRQGVLFDRVMHAVQKQATDATDQTQEGPRDGFYSRPTSFHAQMRVSSKL